MPFQFSLQKVLEYRERLEEEARGAFSAAQSAVNAAADELNRLYAARNEAQTRLCDPSLENGERWLTEAYLRGLRTDTASCEERLAELRRVAEERRAALVRCAVDRGLLDKLKERRLRSYRKEEALKEQKQYDEIATMRRAASPF